MGIRTRFSHLHGHGWCADCGAPVTDVENVDDSDSDMALVLGVLKDFPEARKAIDEAVEKEIAKTTAGVCSKRPNGLKW